jgi:hypothetical protein
MVKEPIPYEICKEYNRVRTVGGFIDVFLPLIALIATVLIWNVDFIGEAESLGDFQVLRYGLVAFSVTVCVVARVMLGRMMSAVRRAVKAEAYRPGRITYCYLAVYALYLVPSVWGFAYFILTGGFLAFQLLAAITILAYVFLTPGPEHFWRQDQ